MDEQLVKQLFELVKSTLDRVDKLEATFNDMVCSINDAKSEYDTDQRRLGFRERHENALSKYNDKLKAIEGDDFDVVDNAFAEYDKLENKPEEAEYIAALCAKIDEQLDKIAKAYGVTETEAKHDAEGTEITADTDHDGEAETEEKIAEVESTEEDTERHESDEEEAKAEEELEEDEEEIDNPEEIKKFVEELEEEAKRLK